MSIFGSVFADMTCGSRPKRSALQSPKNRALRAGQQVPASALGVGLAAGQQGAVGLKQVVHQVHGRSPQVIAAAVPRSSPGAGALDTPDWTFSPPNGPISVSQLSAPNGAFKLGR